MTRHCILETEDIFQTKPTEWGEIVGMQRMQGGEICLWISGHKSTWTPDEFYALAGAMRTVVSGNRSTRKRAE